MAADDDDFQMQSSSSEADDTEFMFPTADDATLTPQHTQQLFEDAPRLPIPNQSSELSPPTSQEVPMQIGTVRPEDDMELTESQAQIAGNETGEQIMIGGIESRKLEEHEPGYAWKNKKAREEFSRAMDQVADKDFNLREFGDLFDETNLSSKQ